MLIDPRPRKANEWERGAAANPLLLRLLELARYFISPATRHLALSVIRSRSYYFRAAELIRLSYEYSTKLLFAVAFERLVGSPLRDLTQQDVEDMGPTVYVALARLKEGIQQHRSILAAEEPEFESDKSNQESDHVYRPRHCEDCKDNVTCEADWRQGWWNGMGRSLLDGRNPLTWTDAVQQFERMEFGQMHPGCLLLMLESIRGGEGNNHVFDMITGVCGDLVDTIEEVDEGEA
jgi:hypothetical protein